MRLSIFIQLMACTGNALAFAPTVTTQNPLSMALFSHPFTAAANGVNEKQAAENAYKSYAVDVMQRYEEMQQQQLEEQQQQLVQDILNNGISSEPISPPPSTTSASVGHADAKKTPKLPNRNILVRTLGMARSTPVTKAKQDVAKETPHRRTFTPMERKLASDQALRMDDSIKPVTVSLDAPPVFTEKPADATPRTGTVGKHAPRATISFSPQNYSEIHRTLTPVERKQTSAEVVQDFDAIRPVAVPRSSPPVFAEWPAPSTPVSGTTKQNLGLP